MFHSWLSTQSLLYFEQLCVSALTGSYCKNMFLWVEGKVEKSTSPRSYVSPLPYSWCYFNSFSIFNPSIYSKILCILFRVIIIVHKSNSDSTSKDCLRAYTLCGIVKNFLECMMMREFLLPQMPSFVLPVFSYLLHSSSWQPQVFFVFMFVSFF